ncbi:MULTISPECIES: histidine decarboxylase [Asanoa]|uniref:Histidine decarboxylase n=2 Tax=Asanoa TaxID=195964 RepID=A0A239PFE4_9ACTN|nr:MULTISPECIES: histidine decarboxylase [Asanoa]GIF74205.1 histidine decarboxylase [Asanoa siamensis]SNT65720.1 histidine decarboxylase [Asanoa hainanensis]
MSTIATAPADLSQAMLWSSDGPHLDAKVNLQAAHQNKGDRLQRREHARSVIAGFCQFLDQDRLTSIGFPTAYDLDVTDLLPLMGYVLNNIGDPVAQGSAFPAHTKAFERQVVDWFARLLAPDPRKVWGYVTSGSSEAIGWALLQARSLYPHAVVYHSADAHFSVSRWAYTLGLPAVSIPTDETGVLDLAALDRAVRRQARRRQWQPPQVIVVATIGTTMTEAVDDVAAITAILDQAGITRRYIHADAALSGIPLALLPPQLRPPFGLADVDSVSVSGHKFLGAPIPSGVVLTHRAHMDAAARRIAYVGTTANTLLSSRSGHGPVMLWYALLIEGEEGLRARADHARRIANYTVMRLRDVGVWAWRHPHAMTVVLDRPADEVIQRWHLATSGSISHLICMPRITTAQIDAFCDDVAESVRLRRRRAVR